MTSLLARCARSVSKTHRCCRSEGPEPPTRTKPGQASVVSGQVTDLLRCTPTPGNAISSVSTPLASHHGAPLASRQEPADHILNGVNHGSFGEKNFSIPDGDWPYGLSRRRRRDAVADQPGKRCWYSAISGVILKISVADRSRRAGPHSGGRGTTASGQESVSANQVRAILTLTVGASAGGAGAGAGRGRGLVCICVCRLMPHRPGPARWRDQLCPRVRGRVRAAPGAWRDGVTCS